MRQNYEKQMSMSGGRPDHELSRELRVISDILDSHPEIYNTVRRRAKKSLVKKDRETEFGHKVALMAGKSAMILDCMIAENIRYGQEFVGVQTA